MPREEGKVDYLKAFISGSWISFTMEGFDSSVHLTPGKIRRSMEVFERDYKVEVDMYPYYCLLLWELTLEESVAQRKKSRRKSRGVQEQPSTPGDASAPAVIKMPRVHRYKLAVNEKEKLLFSNKGLPMKVRGYLMAALRCEDLTIMDLSQATPLDLLMFHNQAVKQRPGIVALQRADQLASLREEVVDRALWSEEEVGVGDEDKRTSEVYGKIGSHDELIPCIKKLSLTVDNVPVKSEVSDLAGYRISQVEADVIAPSVFHLYVDLARAGILEAVPSWLIKARNSGRNTVTARYN